MYQSLHQRSLSLLKQAPVTIDRDLRQVVALALVSKLQEYTAQVLALSASSNHVHLLAKMPPGLTPKLWVGYAKREATFQAKEIGWEGKLWARGGKPNRIRDRQHQLNTDYYILRHRDERAGVWDYKDYESK